MSLVHRHIAEKPKRHNDDGWVIPWPTMLDSCWPWLRVIALYWPSLTMSNQHKIHNDVSITTNQLTSAMIYPHQPLFNQAGYWSSYQQASTVEFGTQATTIAGPTEGSDPFWEWFALHSAPWCFRAMTAEPG